MKKAVISGIGGMDASHLAELLLSDNVQVIGFHRRTSLERLDRIKHILSNPNLTIEEGDITDSHYINRLLERERPDYFFNAAAQSHVGTSFSQPYHTIEVNTLGVLNILEGIKNYSKDTKMVQFSTSEMWGKNIDSDGFQRESTPFAPVSPYGVSKLASFELCRTYRESYDIFACSSICHNHTSPRRGNNFFEKKVVNWAAGNFKYLKASGPVITNKVDSSKFIVGDLPERDKLKVGNLNSYRDFIHSKDCVKAIYLMAKAEKPKDYVISSGIATKMEDLIKSVFNKFNRNFRDYIYIDMSLYRPVEIPFLKGDSSLIRSALGWAPEYTFDDIIEEMVKYAVSEVHHNM